MPQYHLVRYYEVYAEGPFHADSLEEAVEIAKNDYEGEDGWKGSLHEVYGGGEGISFDMNGEIV